MFIELAKKLREANEDLSLTLSVDGTLFTIGIQDLKNDVIYYSYSSSNLMETYYKVNHYINCLKDPVKMRHYIDGVEKGNWEVVNV